MLGGYKSGLIGSEIWRAPVDMVKISPLFTAFIHAKCCRISEPSIVFFDCPKSIKEPPFSLEKYEAPRISEEGPEKFLPPQQSFHTKKKMSRLDVGQLMVDDCNSMIHQPFSGTGFQSLPKSPTLKRCERTQKTTAKKTC